MITSSLIVLADRGGLRAYDVEATAARGPHLKLVQAFDVPDVLSATTLQHRTPMGDWPQLEAEMERRLCKELAVQIVKTVDHLRGENWAFAAPKAICSKIIKLLPLEIRRRLVEQVESDLVKADISKLPAYFRSVRLA